MDHKSTTLFTFLRLFRRVTVVLLAIKALSVEVSALFEDCLFAFLVGGEESPAETVALDSFLNA